MEKYAAVYFGPGEGENLRKFYHGMNGLEIIQLSQDELNRSVEEFEYMKVGVNNELVLHGEEQVNSFQFFMKAFMPDKEFEISDQPGSKEFKEWLDNKNK